MKRHLWVALGLIVSVAGCGGTRESRDESITREVEKKAAEVETSARRSRTLSSLAKLEEALASFVKAERRIPDSLDELIPKYLAEIPSVEIDVRGHRDNALVKAYPTSVLRDGQIDGSQLKDSGRWGYVHNERQIVVFVDCTHPSGNGMPWYREKGAF